MCIHIHSYASHQCAKWKKKKKKKQQKAELYAEVLVFGYFMLHVCAKQRISVIGYAGKLMQYICET